MFKPGNLVIVQNTPLTICVAQQCKLISPNLWSRDGNYYRLNIDKNRVALYVGSEGPRDIILFDGQIYAIQFGQLKEMK